MTGYEAARTRGPESKVSRQTGRLDDEAEEELAPNNINRLAADTPPKEFNEESMSRLSPSGDSHRRGRLVRLALMAKYDWKDRAKAI